MPRPQYVKDLLAAAPRDGTIDPAWQRRMDDAVRFVIGMQERAGIDIISDGEWRRESYVDIIADVMHGFRWVKRDEFAYHQVVTERMTPRRVGAVAAEARFLKENTDRRVKVCLPSPYLIGQRMWVPEYSAGAYPTREAFCDALVPVLHEELLRVSEVGVEVVQFDEPHLCVLVDPKVRAQFADPEAEMKRAVDGINAIVQGAGGVALACHLCRRNWGRKGWGAAGGYEAILPHMRCLNVGQFALEFSIPVAGDVAVLRELPDHLRIGLGCVDVRFAEIDAPETIAARVEQALPHVAADRLVLNPDCGFAPGKDHEIPLEEAYAKLKNLARAAKLLRERHAQRA